MKKGNEKGAEEINIGIVGHIDHGKTTLLQRLSGKWADTHSEELRRGITIKLGYADIVIYKEGDNYNIEGKGEAVKHVSFIDAPGHEMLMATMLSGAALIDAGLLVVAANEGIKPQTREHLMALQAKNVRHLIVVQNKIDLVDKTEAKESYKEIKKLLSGRYDNAPIIPVSAQQGVNINSVLEAIVKLPVPERDLSVEPVFLIARSFDVNKPGTKPTELKGAVLGGTLKQGILKPGDEIEIKPGKAIKEEGEKRYESIKTRIRNVFEGNEEVKELRPGGSVSIESGLDMSLGKSDQLAGNVASLIGKLPDISFGVKIGFKLFPEVFGITGHERVEEIKQGEILMLSVNTSISGGAVKDIKENELELRLKIPIVAFRGDKVGIARNIKGHWRLIGYGEVI